VNPPRKDLTRGERLALALAGLFVIAYGYGQILRGRVIYENWLAMDVPADFVILLGALCLLVAIFPWGRIHFLWDTGRKKHRLR
jgi:hypothetical protein